MLSFPNGGNWLKSGISPSPNPGNPPKPPKPKGFSPRLSPEVVTLSVSSSIAMSFFVLMPRQPSPVAMTLSSPLPLNSSLPFAQIVAALWFAVSLQAVMVSAFFVPLAATTSTFFLFLRSSGAPSWLVSVRLSSVIFALPAVFNMSCPLSLFPVSLSVSLWSLYILSMSTLAPSTLTFTLSFAFCSTLAVAPLYRIVISSA